MAPASIAALGDISLVSAGQVLADHRVHLGLDGVDLLGGERRGVGEVEADPLAVDHLALLGDVLAQHVAQRRVQQMGGGVVGAGGDPARGVDRQPRALALGQPALGDLQGVDVQVAGLLLGVEHAAAAALPLDLAGVAGLAAALGVEGGGVEQDLDGLAGLGGVALSPSRTMARTSPVVSSSS